MAANASAHSNLVTLHTHLHNVLLKLSLALHLSSPCPTSHNQQQPPTTHTHTNRLSTQHFSSLTPTYKPPPIRQGFMETPENSPPLLEGHRMQIMVIPRGVRKIVIHFLVYDPIRKEKQEKSKEERKISPLSSTSGSSFQDSTSNSKVANPQAQIHTQTQMRAQTSRNKLRKKISTNLHPSISKPRDQITNQRSTSRLSNTSPEPNARLSMNQNLDLSQNSDGMEIEVLRKGVMSVMDSEQREEDEQGEYVVMKRVVRLPRRVWCGRNCKDKFEQLFIRRT
ncbi:hypothetical protein EAF04_006007 [Stromatinia cepivora]|nr:hypothetical protein EAF04_006007 [Stromatinia cepivora]